MRLLSIDQSLRCSGWSLFPEDQCRPGLVFPQPTAYGWVRTKQDKKDKANVGSLHDIYQELELVFREGLPTHVVSEMFFAKSAKGTLACGEVRGLIKLLCAQKGVQFLEMAVQTARKATLGFGNAQKIDGEKFVLKNLADQMKSGLSAVNEDERQDVTDSIVMGIAAIRLYAENQPS